jgi:SAM-dependent methyltransferase
MKIDFGCGPRKKEGFLGVDQYAMEGVDVVLNIGVDPWPWEDGTVEEVNASHFLEHLPAHQRAHFMNEAYRVMKDGAKATIVTPHWASNRAYGDFNHALPPVAEMFYYYLKREWRATNASHTDIKWNPAGYSCDFDATWGYSFAPDLAARHPDHIQFALQNYKEAALDLYATLVKPVKVTD